MCVYLRAQLPLRIRKQVPGDARPEPWMPIHRRDEIYLFDWELR